jgi:hypothetical protein
MPTAYIRKLHVETGINLADLERMWQRAKKLVTTGTKKRPKWGVVMKVFQNMVQARKKSLASAFPPGFVSRRSRVYAAPNNYYPLWDAVKQAVKSQKPQGAALVNGETVVVEPEVAVSLLTNMRGKNPKLMAELISAMSQSRAKYLFVARSHMPDDE